MKKILLIHGPNLNRLGERDQEHYGTVTLSQIEELVSGAARKLGYTVECFQSNHEGILIDYLQEKSEEAVGIIMNPGALSHYSYALHDAILDTKKFCIEVHLSKIEDREPWRRVSVIAPACIHQITGKKEQGYAEAVELLHKELSNKL